MNDIIKERISLKLANALKDEGITQKEASEILGLNSIYYPSMIISGRSNQWVKVSAKAWEQVRGWVCSGETLKNYSLLTKEEKETYNKSTEQQDEAAKTEIKTPPDEPDEAKRSTIKKEKNPPRKSTSEDSLVIFLNSMKKMGYKVEIKINN